VAREERLIVRLQAITPLPPDGVHWKKNFIALGLEQYGIDAVRAPLLENRPLPGCLE
jgi:hypothetical protein